MNIKKTITGIACAALLTGCNLDYSEYSNYDEDYISESYENVIAIITNVYSMLDYDFGQNYSGGMLASACDEAEYAYSSNDICDFTNGSWSASNPQSVIWTDSYEAIQICNYYLENFQGMDFEELELNDDYKAQMFRYTNSFNEARLLRAYFYFNLARAYGDVPYFTETVSTDNVNTLTRTPVLQVFDSIMATCDELYTELPADYTNLGTSGISPSETGRFTCYAALALKARTALYAASPLFNTDGDESRWEAAVEANKAVIDTCLANGFQLNDYEDLWGTSNWSNTEMIFVRRYSKTTTGASSVLEGYNYPIGTTGGNSGNCPSQNLVDAYEMQATGLAWDEDGSGYDAENPYDGRDPRFEMTIAKNGDTWPTSYGTTLATYYGGTNGLPTSGATPTGYYLKKYLDGNIDLSSSSTYKTSVHSWITYRLGEFYLNYAEAIFQLTGSADDDGGYGMTAREAVNVIRNRDDVQMPEFEEGMTADAFWEKYQNERMVELAFEGHRFYDLRRWEEGDKLSSITEMNITLNDDGSYTYERETVSRTWDDKMYLFPIPQTEIAKNPNLTQNSGW
ncbi:MAG: RagB/SusD family nutrient uptake outer membrane protein [Bacteroides sp.]|nr:RagB/SusD family nutrient uptake outer membrane protein [Bacteroides sp.]